MVYYWQNPRGKVGIFMQNHTNASPTIYNQVRNVLLLGIVITLLLSLVASFLLNLMSENRSRDQTLESSAQVAANMPPAHRGSLRTGDHRVHPADGPKRPQHRRVRRLRPGGEPPSPSTTWTHRPDDATALASLSQDIVDWFLAGNATLIYNGEAPPGQTAAPTPPFTPTTAPSSATP